MTNAPPTRPSRRTTDADQPQPRRQPGPATEPRSAPADPATPRPPADPLVTLLPPAHPLVTGATAASPLIRALRGDRPTRTPVWFMRQAGRSLPEYRAARSGTPMLEACLTPELAAELTLQPVRRHGVDAAIFFSDIVVPLKLAGVAVDIRPGVGPVLDRAYDTPQAIAELTERELTDAALAPIRHAVALTVAQLADLPPRPGAEGATCPPTVAPWTDLPPRPGAAGSPSPPTITPLADRPSPPGTAGTVTPLIGFAGAPFTVAAYVVEGRPSRDHLGVRRLMHADPASWRRLTTWVAGLTGRFLAAQVEAGASAVQLFDSWAGALSLADYLDHVAPASVQALRSVAAYRVGAPVAGDDPGPGRPSPAHGAAAPAAPALAVPVLHFGVGTGHLLTALRDVETAAGVIHRAVGVDDRTPLDQALGVLGPGVAVQGNIDPARLGAPWPVLEAHVGQVMSQGLRGADGQPPGHVVNLGHGVPPATDPAVLTRIVESVHAVDWRELAASGVTTASEEER